MKARTGIIQEKDVKKALDAEWNRRIDEIYESVKKDIVPQIMATCAVELNKEFGFGKNRLNRFKSGVEGLFKAMTENGIMGKEFTTENCIEYMQKMGIDFDETDI